MFLFAALREKLAAIGQGKRSSKNEFGELTVLFKSAEKIFEKCQTIPDFTYFCLRLNNIHGKSKT